MSKIDRIEADIEITKAERADAKRTGEIKELRALLTVQTSVLKHLLAIQQGNFHFLSLHITRSNAHSFNIYDSYDD
jgi:phage terminase large subunit GpA-like protein